MNRSVALRVARHVSTSSHESSATAFSRLPLSCWRCHLSRLSSVPTHAPSSLSLPSSRRLLHGSSSAQQSAATVPHNHRAERSEHLSRASVEEHIDDEEDAATEPDWSPPAFTPAPPNLSDLMTVARSGASQSAMDSPLHQTLVALVQSGDVSTALSHLRSLHCTATVDSWNLLLSAMAQRLRFDEVAELWALWQSALPSVGQPVPADYDRLLYPNATTYGILLRSPPSHRLLTANDALTQLSSRGLPPSTFIYNTLLKEYIHAKDYTSATGVVDLMLRSGVAQDVYTMSMRFTIFSKCVKQVEPAAKYELVTVLWDDLMALQLPRVPLSLGFAFVWHICQANDTRRLVQLVNAIVNTSGPPDVVHQAKPVELMLGCLLRNDRLQEMIQLYRYMRRVGFKMTYKHFFALVAGFARQSETNGMMRVFNEMVGHGMQPGLAVFETMLQAHGRVGDEEAAGRMIRRMSDFGVQPTIDCVSAIARGIHERHTAERSEASVTPKGQTALLEGAAQTLALSAAAPSSSGAPSLSVEYLTLFELADELGMTPAPYMYHRLLQALHEESDLRAMLFFLYDMKRKGVAVCLSELQWVLWQLSLLAHTEPSVHVRLMAMQASLIVEGEENSLGALSSYYLLSIYVGVCDVAGFQRVYRSIHERKIRVTWDIILRMMQQCLRADSSDVREHERMQFVTQVYQHMRASNKKYSEPIFNEVLQAYAVLGDTTGMKEVLSAMRGDGVAIGEATLAVLDEAREHVLYTADIANYVAQQRNRITTLQMESNIRMKHKAELRLAAAGRPGAEPTRLAAIDAPVAKADVRSLFALPEWSPLYDQTEAEAEAERAEEAATAAAVGELQSALSAFLSSLPGPILHAEHFPAADGSVVQQLDEAVAAGPTAKELLTINRRLRAVQTTWPGTVEQREERNQPKDVHPRASTYAAAAFDGPSGSGARLQPIDAAQQRSAESAAPTSSSFSATSPRARLTPASTVGLLSSAPQPGCIERPARITGTVMRLTRGGTIGRLPRFPCMTDTVTARRLKAAAVREADERRSSAVTTPAEQSTRGVAQSPVLPLPAATASAPFFTAIESHAETVAIADGGKRKRRARKSNSSAESGKQRDAYHGGWVD